MSVITAVCAPAVRVNTKPHSSAVLSAQCATRPVSRIASSGMTEGVEKKRLIILTLLKWLEMASGKKCTTFSVYDFAVYSAAASCTGQNMSLASIFGTSVCHTNNY